MDEYLSFVLFGVAVVTLVCVVVYYFFKIVLKEKTYDENAVKQKKKNRKKRKRKFPHRTKPVNISSNPSGKNTKPKSNVNSPKDLMVSEVLEETQEEIENLYAHKNYKKPNATDATSGTKVSPQDKKKLKPKNESKNVQAKAIKSDIELPKEKSKKVGPVNVDLCSLIEKVKLPGSQIPNLIDFLLSKQHEDCYVDLEWFEGIVDLLYTENLHEQLMDTLNIRIFTKVKKKKKPSNEVSRDDKGREKNDAVNFNLLYPSIAKAELSSSQIQELINSFLLGWLIRKQFDDSLFICKEWIYSKRCFLMARRRLEEKMKIRDFTLLPSDTQKNCRMFMSLQDTYPVD